MTIGLQTAAYISATVLFILALGGLSNQEKAKRAVWFGIIGMAIAVVATVAEPSVALQLDVNRGNRDRCGHRCDCCQPSRDDWDAAVGCGTALVCRFSGSVYRNQLRHVVT